MEEKIYHNKRIVFTIALVAAIGGLLNGFMTSLIAVVLPLLRNDWALSSKQQEWVVASAIAGAVIGALFGARSSNLVGRKNIILASAVIFIIGTILCSTASNHIYFSLWRFVIGIAIGLSSFSIPQYISEVSPTRNRSALINLNQLMITIGILFAFLNGLYLLSTENQWRWVVMAGLIPSLLLLVGILLLPKSPKWLIQKGRFSQARTILLQIEEQEKTELIMEIMKQEVETERGFSFRWRDMAKSKYFPITMIGIMVMFVQQCTGINIFIYYSPIIFEVAGFHLFSSELSAAMVLAIVNVLFTVVSIAISDYVGRRRVYLIGLSGMILSSLFIGTCFHFNQAIGDSLKWLVFGGSIFFVICFSISLGPLAWIIVSEIVPNRLRNLIMSISITANWIFNFIITFTYFKISKHWSMPGYEFIVKTNNNGIADIFFNPAINFWIYGFIGIISLVYGYYKIPETKGMTYLDIDDYWSRRWKRKHKDIKWI